MEEVRRRDAAEVAWLGTTAQGRPTFAEAELLDLQGVPSCHAWKVPEGPTPDHLSPTDALRRWQAGACAMCGARRGSLVVDHCHRTGLVRRQLTERRGCRAGRLPDRDPMCDSRMADTTCRCGKITALAQPSISLYGREPCHHQPFIHTPFWSSEGATSAGCQELADLFVDALGVQLIAGRRGGHGQRLCESAHSWPSCFGTSHLMVTCGQLGRSRCQWPAVPLVASIRVAGCGSPPRPTTQGAGRSSAVLRIACDVDSLTRNRPCPIP